MAKVQEHREFESRVKKLRETVKKNSVDYDKSEEPLEEPQQLLLRALVHLTTVRNALVAGSPESLAERWADYRRGG